MRLLIRSSATVDVTKTTTLLFVATAMLMGGCNGCLKPQTEKKALEVVQPKNETVGFSLSAQQIFSHASFFNYNSEMSVTTKKGTNVEEDFEAIEIKGAKPRIVLKKKTDSQHFIEIFAEGDTYYVRNGGKEYRRGSDNTPLYQTLIDDGFNLLPTLLADFELSERVVVKNDGSSKKIYGISPGPISPTAPFVQALIKNTPSFGEVVGSDATGSFTVDERSGLPIAGSLTLSLAGKDERTLLLKASFNLEMRGAGEQLAMPVIKDDELNNYPVDIGRRFNDLLNAKESK